MNFIADVMLGKLAKRLRLLGFDVLYESTFDDNEVIRLALEQNRMILTRDRALAQRPLAANHLLIKKDAVDEQLEQVFSEFTIQSAEPLSRCSRCNSPLQKLSRDDVRDRVPRYVYERYASFWQCPSCERIYWKGTHTERMKRAARSRLSQ
jgi:uncharacterized protein with PIN domain